MEYIVQETVVVFEGSIIFRGQKLPEPPGYKRSGNRIAVCNHRLYINGYEWKNGAWRRTTAALLHNMI